MAYRAFFSYSRADDRIANWLHGQLDRYRTPKDIVASQGVSAKLHPIFRDRTDLQSGGQLDEALRRALNDSEALIVLCTPTSAKSQWVNAECEAFVESGRQSRIFPVIAAGAPNSGDPETECFPPALRERGLLAADLRELKLESGQTVGDGREIGRLKLIAGLLGLPLDLLVRRERRRQRTILSAAIAAALVFAGLAVAAAGFGWLAQLRSVELARERDVVMLRESALVAANARTHLLTGAGADAAQLLLPVLPNAEQPDRPLSLDAVSALAAFVEFPAQRVELGAPDAALQSVSFSPDGDTALVFLQRQSGALTASLVSLATGARHDIEYAFATPVAGAIFFNVAGKTAVWPLGAVRQPGPSMFVVDGPNRARRTDAPQSWSGLPNARVLADGSAAALLAYGDRLARLDKATGVIGASQMLSGSVIAAHADTGRVATYRGGVLRVIEIGAAMNEIQVAPISYAAFSQDGARLLIVDAGGMRIWSPTLRGASRAVEAHDIRCQSPHDVAFGPAGDIVVEGEGAVCRFNADGRLQRVIVLPASADQLSPDGEWALVGEALLRTRGAFRDEVLADGQGFEATRNCLAADPLPASCAPPEAGALSIDGRQYHLTRSPAVMSPNRRYAGVADEDGAFAVVDLNEGRIVCSLAREALFVFDRGPVVLVGEGRRFGVAACAGAAGPDDLGFDQGASVESGIADGPQFAALSSDGARLLTAGPEHSIKLWDLATQTLLWSARTSDRASGMTSDGHYFNFEGPSAPVRWVVQLPPAQQALLNPSNWVPPPLSPRRDIVVWSRPNAATGPIGSSVAGSCATTGARMRQAANGLPPYTLVSEIIACAGLSERVAAQWGDDVIEHDMLVVRAAGWTRDELAARYPWLTTSELASLRRAVGAEREE